MNTTEFDPLSKLLPHHDGGITPSQTDPNALAAEFAIKHDGWKKCEAIGDLVKYVYANGYILKLRITSFPDECSDYLWTASIEGLSGCYVAEAGNNLIKAIAAANRYPSFFKEQMRRSPVCLIDSVRRCLMPSTWYEAHQKRKLAPLVRSD